jgi:hypothetical protein
MKPHAFYVDAGRGYWIVRLITGGFCVQGVAATLTEAYISFKQELERWQSKL